MTAKMNLGLATEGRANTLYISQAARGRQATANPSTENSRDEFLNGEIFYSLRKTRYFDRAMETALQHQTTSQQPRLQAASTTNLQPNTHPP